MSGKGEHRKGGGGRTGKMSHAKKVREGTPGRHSRVVSRGIVPGAEQRPPTFTNVLYSGMIGEYNIRVKHTCKLTEKVGLGIRKR